MVTGTGLDDAATTRRNGPRQGRPAFAGGPRQLPANVDEQDLGFLRGRDGNGTLGRDASAIPGAENDVAESDLSPHEVEPRASPWCELVHQVLSWVEQ